MVIPAVYHWSPKKNRDSILKEGLKIMMREMHYENPVTGKSEVWIPPYICTSIEPMMALRYVLPTFDENDEGDLDLFWVVLNDNDRIKIRNDDTRELIEVRILNSIEASRVHYVATRST